MLLNKKQLFFRDLFRSRKNVILIEKNLLDSFFLAVYDKALCTVGSYTWFVYNLSTEWTYFMGDPG